MEEIVAAIITGIVGPIILLVVQRVLSEMKRPEASNDRLNIIRGKWSGSFSQAIENNMATFPIDLTAEIRWRTVTAEAKYKNSKEEYVEIIFF